MKRITSGFCSVAIAVAVMLGAAGAAMAQAADAVMNVSVTVTAAPGDCTIIVDPLAFGTVNPGPFGGIAAADIDCSNNKDWISVAFDGGLYGDQNSFFAMSNDGGITQLVYSMEVDFGYGPEVLLPNAIFANTTNEPAPVIFYVSGASDATGAADGVYTDAVTLTVAY